MQHDSVVSPSIAYDLMMECKTIGEGLKRCPALLGEDVVIEPIESKVWMQNVVYAQQHRADPTDERRRPNQTQTRTNIGGLRRPTDLQQARLLGARAGPGGVPEARLLPQAPREQQRGRLR